MRSSKPAGVPNACWARFQRWMPPPNWSRRDWLHEMAAQAHAAAWQARFEFDPAHDSPLEAFVHRRVLASVIHHYRAEWRYVCICGGSCICSPDGEHTFWTLEDIAMAAESRFPDIDLCEALSLLCPEDQRLIHALFWEGRSEAEVAREWELSQPAVNKRKHLALRRLRSILESCEVPQAETREQVITAQSCSDTPHDKT